MCGFIGYINGTNVIDHHQTIENMMNTIIHRGPDSGGIHSDDKVTLGFRRLSIIDLSDVANQPLYSADGNIVLVFNGEIFNFQELRADLVEKGHNFKTHSDSEVIIYGYVEYGVEFVKSFAGCSHSVFGIKRMICNSSLVMALVLSRCIIQKTLQMVLLFSVQKLNHFTTPSIY